MEKIPNELCAHIFSYLKTNELKPFDKLSNIIMKSNVIWEPRTKKKFDIKESINYYQEYQWQLKLKKHLLKLAELIIRILLILIRHSNY